MALTPIDKKSRLLEISQGMPAGAVEHHFRRLDGDYWNEFSAEEIHAHLIALKSLTYAAPHFVSLQKLAEDLYGLTLIGGDYPGFFAALSGFLTADGYDIRAGKAFTFPPDADLPVLSRGGLIDFLILRGGEGSEKSEEQTRLLGEMKELFRRFEAGESSKVRLELYRRIGERLEKKHGLQSAPPLEISFHALNTGTQLALRGRDREAMLFCISSALSLQGLSLTKLLTTAHGDGSFEDRLTVTGPNRTPIQNSRELEKIRTGIALMERLLETLPAATDLQAASEGLQTLVDDWLEETSALSEDGPIEILPALSRVLTAGTHMWEMVERLGPESFRQLLREMIAQPVAPTVDHHLKALRKIADIAKDAESETRFEKVRAYRERELLKAELDLLLTPARDLNAFSGRLASLAEALLIYAVDAIAEELKQKHGTSCPFALFALGKFGGEEMGSGSDLEILLVYSETGQTSGPEKLRNGEFYEQLCRRLARALETRPGATLSLDFRLRPHGDSGPMAASFEAWKNYFAQEGGALDYEKQALIRLRPVHGDESLIHKVLALRDEITYAAPPVSIMHTLELHTQQAALKTRPGIWNAKYSPGGMVELEYAVQFLQLTHGAAKPPVRQSNLSRALEALLEAGVLTLAEFEHLYTAHLFLRRLINSLRLVRENAADLHCPLPSSSEFSFLAKRLNYVSRNGVKAETRLERDLNQTRRVVGGFFQHRFQGGPRPDWLYEGFAETLMDSEASLEEAQPILERLGMRDFARARTLFLQLFDALVEKRLAAACLLQFEGLLRRSADPEGVVQKLGQYLGRLEHPDLFIRQALQNPAMLETLLEVFGNSDMLSEWVMREGETFKIVAEPESLEKPRMAEEYQALAAEPLRDGNDELESQLCRLRNREYLRIALRDLRLGVPLREITYEISRLSGALVDAAFKHALEKSGRPDLANHFCVLALGKFGGLELNYSSDIDLVFVLSDAMNRDNGREACEKIGREFIALLTRATPEGRLFRVDMNLRPWGGQGPLAGTLTQYQGYYATEAHGWELQAWLKARAVCGNLELGSSLVNAVQAMACSPDNRAKVDESMRKVRLLGLDKLNRDQALSGEVKLGPGGIRTVEFFAQSEQIHHAAAIPELRTGNTLEALGRLRKYGLLAGEKFQLLSDAYVFLRRVEHRLQLQALQQRHALPTDSRELERLAKQMGFEDRIGQPAVRGFLEQYRKHMLNLQPISAELFEH